MILVKILGDWTHIFFDKHWSEKEENQESIYFEFNYSILKWNLVLVKTISWWNRDNIPFTFNLNETESTMSGVNILLIDSLNKWTGKKTWSDTRPNGPPRSQQGRNMNREVRTQWSELNSLRWQIKLFDGLRGLSLPAPAVRSSVSDSATPLGWVWVGAQKKGLCKSLGSRGDALATLVQGCAASSALLRRGAWERKVVSGLTTRCPSVARTPGRVGPERPSHPTRPTLEQLRRVGWGNRRADRFYRRFGLQSNHALRRAV